MTEWEDAAIRGNTPAADWRPVLLRFSAMTAQQQVVVPYNPDWPNEFAMLGRRLRAALGSVAVRIDHIGSTSVPGLAAKPIIDILISVSALEPLDAYRMPIERCGFIWKDNPDKIKRFFHQRPGDRLVNIHVVRSGSFVEQFHLLFRDYLREHPQRAAEYAVLKYELAPFYAQQVVLQEQAQPAVRHPQPYTDRKGPFIWETVRLAYEWSFDVGWNSGPSDA